MPSSYLTSTYLNHSQFPFVLTFTMSPSLEFYETVAEDLPIKPLTTKVNGVAGVATVQLDGSDKHEMILAHFRTYIADLCQQFGGGHPGYVGLLYAGDSNR